MRYKIILSGILFFAFMVSKAQSLPNISYQDYGFKKQVSQVEQIFYSFEGDSIEKVEKVAHRFNPDGNISSYENQSFLDGSWAKSKTTYRKGRMILEAWKHSNSYLDRKCTFYYDKENRIIKEKIRFKDAAKSTIKFQYKNEQLQRIDANMDGVTSTTKKLYSQNGNLYKEIHYQKVTNEKDIVTNYYFLEDKEILSFVEPNSSFYANAYLNNQIEIKFKLAEDSIAQNKLLKGIMRFDTEAPKDNLPFNLQKYSEQTIQAFQKNKYQLTPIRMLLFYHNEFGDTIAEAEVDIKNNTIAGIGFSKLNYSNGSTSGSCQYHTKIRQYFEQMLLEFNLF